MENTYNIPEELSERFSKYKLTTIKYKTSELGVLLEVLNWKEISQVMSSMFDDIVEVLAKGDEKTKLALKKKMDPLKAMYSTQQGIEQLVIKELHYFHFPMGLEYDITTPLTYQDELANMFGGKPIKGQVKLYFEDVDFDQGFCVLKQDMNLNPEDTKNLLKHVFKKMNLNDKKMKKALKTAVFKIEDRNVYEYYYNPGIPHRIETTRETVVNIDNENGRIIDKIIIELIYNDDEE